MTDLSTTIRKLNEALLELHVNCDFSEDELRSECENAIDNAIEDDTTICSGHGSDLIE